MRSPARSLLRKLGLDQPLTFEALCDRIEARTRRRLEFKPWTLPSAITGAWFRSPAADYVFYPTGTAPGHQRHCQLHELAHILLGHEPVSEDTELVTAAIGLTGPAGTVAHVLYRHSYASTLERAAETLATRLTIHLVEPAAAFEDEDLDRHVQNCLGLLSL